MSFFPCFEVLVKNELTQRPPLIFANITHCFFKYHGWDLYSQSRRLSRRKFIVHNHDPIRRCAEQPTKNACKACERNRLFSPNQPQRNIYIYIYTHTTNIWTFSFGKTSKYLRYSLNIIRAGKNAHMMNPKLLPLLDDKAYRIHLGSLFLGEGDFRVASILTQY